MKFCKLLSLLLFSGLAVCSEDGQVPVSVDEILHSYINSTAKLDVDPTRFAQDRTRRFKIVLDLAGRVPVAESTKFVIAMKEKNPEFADLLAVEFVVRCVEARNESQLMNLLQTNPPGRVRRMSLLRYLGSKMKANGVNLLIRAAETAVNQQAKAKIIEMLASDFPGLWEKSKNDGGQFLRMASAWMKEYDGKLEWREKLGEPLSKITAGIRDEVPQEPENPDCFLFTIKK